MTPHTRSRDAPLQGSFSREFRPVHCTIVERAADPGTGRHGTRASLAWAATVPRFEIIRADASRLEEVEPLWILLADHHAELATPAGVSPRPGEDSWPARRAHYEEGLREGGILMLAETAEGAVGYAFANPTRPPETLDLEGLLEIESVAVSPQARGAGIGTALIAAIKEEARRLGVSHLQIGIRVSNEGARRLYEREGFQPLFLTMFSTLS
jgi:ribosomal protein S18 acetylase RimI-like enzyme